MLVRSQTDLAREARAAGLQFWGQASGIKCSSPHLLFTISMPACVVTQLPVARSPPCLPTNQPPDRLPWPRSV